MTIQVLFFASLREQVGQSQAQLDLDTPTDLNTVWQTATQSPVWPEHTLIAINQQYVNADTQVQAGDEVAFFPPVTGG